MIITYILLNINELLYYILLRIIYIVLPMQTSFSPRSVGGLSHLWHAWQQQPLPLLNSNLDYGPKCSLLSATNAMKQEPHLCLIEKNPGCENENHRHHMKATQLPLPS